MTDIARYNYCFTVIISLLQMRSSKLYTRATREHLPNALIYYPHLEIDVLL